MSSRSSTAGVWWQRSTPTMPASVIRKFTRALHKRRRRGAIGIAFLLFLVIEHGQLRAVSGRHLGRFDQCRLQMFVALC